MERNTIICGDCVNVLKRYTNTFDLIFADPPFNINYNYDVYQDCVADYKSWTFKWVQACYNSLKNTGSFWIAINDEQVADVVVIAKRFNLIMRNWVIWYYKFGQNTKNKFSRCHTHLLYFVKGENFTFNQILVPSARQEIYGDSRANPCGKGLDDVWEIKRLCGTHKERLGFHSCQMPEEVLERIIITSSNAGDYVLDPFSGSGTTVSVAKKLGRDYLGVEISESYTKQSLERLNG